jgi:hypothetical protein
LNNLEAATLASVSCIPTRPMPRPISAKVETVGGVFQVREDELKPRIGAGLHRTP